MSRSSYYYNSIGKKDDSELLAKIERITLEYSRYGYRRVTAQLRRDGVAVNHKKVLRIMRENGLTCRVKRRFVRTTDSKHGLPVYPNLLRDFEASAPLQAWVADITYVRLPAGFCYLAVIMDLFTRRVVGWAMSTRIDTDLCLAALWSALDVTISVKGCIHHSDRGVQYASKNYVDTLRDAGMLTSMSRKGNPYDNASMESFMSTYKLEEVYVSEYRTYSDAKRSTAHFIDVVYNQKRLHSALGYLPPVEYEQQWLRDQ
ncbi:MAG: transposase [bacterium]|nr:MAG: transposase [bacterium]